MRQAVATVRPSGRVTSATDADAGASGCGICNGLRSDPLDGARFTREYSDLVER